MFWSIVLWPNYDAVLWLVETRCDTVKWVALKSINCFRWNGWRPRDVHGIFTLQFAAIFCDGTNFEVLEWMINNNCPCQKYTFERAVLKPSVINWLSNHLLPPVTGDTFSENLKYFLDGLQTLTYLDSEGVRGSITFWVFNTGRASQAKRGKKDYTWLKDWKSHQ